MKTITFSNGKTVQVSEELYRTRFDPGLFRKIAGLFGHLELGWHPNPYWVCLVADDNCHDGRPLFGKKMEEDAYLGFHKDWVSPA